MKNRKANSMSRRGLSTLAMLWFLSFTSAGLWMLSGHGKHESRRSHLVTKNIEDIKVGDYVLAKDPGDSGAPTPHRVLDVPRSLTYHIVHVTTSDRGELQSTRLHPFWVLGKGWTEAKDLRTGDDLVDEYGAPVAVTDVRIEEKQAPTFNLTVAGVHTFYVLGGERAVLVHNTGFGNVDGGGPIDAGTALDQGVNWLGSGYREIAPGIFRSSCNTKQFRMTTSDLTDTRIGPHVHMESVGSDGRALVENSHIKICP